MMKSLPKLRNKDISWDLNNMNVKQAWLNSGSTRDHWLSQKVVEMQQILYQQNTIVVPKYIRSYNHQHADYVSREKYSPRLAPVKRPGKEDFPASWPARNRPHGDQPIKTNGKVLFSSFGRGGRTNR